MESLFHHLINPSQAHSSQPSQPSQPPTQPGVDAAASQAPTAHKRESPLDGSQHPDGTASKITKP
eukprot:1070653-Karenia_brevis.AAC.1